MGNHLSGIVPSQILPVESYLNDINHRDMDDLKYESSLGSTRFLKVVKCSTKEGLIVIKVFVIHDQTLVLSDYKNTFDEISKALTGSPNCLAFHHTQLSDKAGFLVRQYIKGSLYDALSTRPFLTTIEKNWLAYQLLSALEQCHRENVCHGDIKLENILVTSWSWLFLADFASFKPVLLPEDNPADFTYFFDTSRRRVCYIAPERFLQTLQRDEQQVMLEVQDRGTTLSPAMDIFSAGCALCELFTDGMTPFDLTHLLKYRKGNYYPQKVLDEIKNQHLKNLIEEMLSKVATERPTAADCLERLKGKVFPNYFYSYLWQFFKQFAQEVVPADERIRRLKESISNIIGELGVNADQKMDSKSVRNETTEAAKEFDFSKEKIMNLVEGDGELDFLKNNEDEDVLSEPLIIVVTLVTSSIRSLKFTNSKTTALELLKTLSGLVDEKVILDRILPYTFYFLNDRDPIVRARAIHTFTFCLTAISQIPPSDINVFQDYIFPSIINILHDESVLVRQVFAENIGILADTALRFLEFCQLNEILPNFEKELLSLYEVMQQKVATLFSDSSNEVKIVLMSLAVNQLCVFFGKQKSNDVILSHMITFLNEKRDQQLRIEFFRCLVGVSVFIGMHCSQIIQPLILQGLTDTEENVIIASIEALSSLTQVGQFEPHMICSLMVDAAPLLTHPNLWIRNSTIGFICTACRILPFLDVMTIIKDLVSPYLRKDVTMLDDEYLLLNAVVNPIPREVFDALVKSSNVAEIIAILREANFRNEPLESLSINKEFDIQTRNLLRRLHGSGLKDHDLKFIFCLDNYLKRLQRYKKTEENAMQNSDKISRGVINIPRTKVHHFKLTEQDASGESFLGGESLIGSNASQLKANEDWQNMLAAEEKKFTPKKGERESTCQEDDSSVVPTSSVKQNLTQSDVVVNNVINRCTSDCQTALNTLLMSRIEDLNSAINMCSSENGKNIYRSKGRFRPKGHLIAHLHEHKRAVLRMTGLHGTSLFASCSQDGTVKLWDCSKTERSYPINRSKATYSKQKGVITSISSCNVNDSIASTSDNGSIHVFKIEKQRAVATKQLDPKKFGFATDVHFMEYNSSPLLTYSTVFGKVIGWDLRAPKDAWVIDNGVRKGVINSFTVDPMNKWLGVGTSSGLHVCWDLRFMLPISEIEHTYGKEPKRLISHPKKNSYLFSSICSNNEVILYDIETQSRIKTVWASPTPPLTKYKRPKFDDGTIDEMVIGLYAGESDGSTFLLTGGTDCRFRYWDLDHPEDSYTIAHSIQYNTEKFVSFYTSRVIDGSEVILENSTSQVKVNGSEEHSVFKMAQPPVGHKDTINDIIVVEHPQRIVVTCSYDGIIKMWK